MSARMRNGPLPPTRRKRPPRKPPIKKRSRRPKKPDLHIYEILAWADKHRARTGAWPFASSGVIQDAPWETWRQVNDALFTGYRGCRPGGSLAQLLLKHRGKPLKKGYFRKARLSIEQILAWADAFHERTGRWPAVKTPGKVAPRRKETWATLDAALRIGGRGLGGRSSLTLLLRDHRGLRRGIWRPRLTLKQILAWADAHHARHGRWPSFGSGPVEDAPGERWASLHDCLENAGRGLPAGYTLATLLAKYRGHRNKHCLPRFTEAGILAWADAHHRRHGRWPACTSGTVRGVRGETWKNVDRALRRGFRGMPGGESLSRFLMRHERRPARSSQHHPPRHTLLSVRQILSWADAFHREHGRWPTMLSGPIPAAADETWQSVESALRLGMRGLPGGSTLARLLEDRRGMHHKGHRPPFSTPELLRWADAYHSHMGRFPSSASGLIPESGDTWAGVDIALRTGVRGLPGGDKLRMFLCRHSRVPVDGRRVRNACAPNPDRRIRGATGRARQSRRPG